MIYTDGNIHYAKIPKKDSSIRFQTYGSLLSMGAFYDRLPKNENEDIYLLNGGVFDFGTKKPCYCYKSDYAVYSEDSLYNGMGIDKDGSLRTGHKDEVFRDFMSGLPTLIKNGLYANKGEGDANHGGWHRRSILGYDNDNYFLLTVDTGYSFDDEYNLCKKLGMTDAINLDGGGSTRLSKNNNVANNPSEDRWCHNYIVIRARREAMEWKEPNWNWIWTKYAQVDKDGKIKVQNNDPDIARKNAEKDGYAVWEKATKKRVYPKEVVQNVTETEKSAIVETNTGEKVFLESIKKMIDERLSNLNG
jgi:hypothetical protein